MIFVLSKIRPDLITKSNGSYLCSLQHEQVEDHELHSVLSRMPFDKKIIVLWRQRRYIGGQYVSESDSHVCSHERCMNASHTTTHTYFWGPNDLAKRLSLTVEEGSPLLQPSALLGTK